MPAERRELRVLHLASFAGNIGDLANHAGARAMLSSHLDFELVFTELEIREFYWKQRHFDDAFVQWANSFDLLMVGGGNYFELWVERSETGTSIDISPARLAALTVPTLFYALGADIGQGYTDITAGRFCTFMDTVLSRDDMFACVRNDGSARALREVLGEARAARIPTMPDGGFFLDEAFPAAHPSPALNGPRVGINIAGDMLEQRFRGEGGPDKFLAGLACLCNGLLQAHAALRIDLVPHIWRDTLLISRLLPLLPDAALRRRVRIAQLDPTAGGLAGFVQDYRAFDLVLGMRFHANVCPIGMGVPARGLLCYPQVGLLYEELGMQDRLADVTADGFDGRLLADCLSDLDARDAVRDRMRACGAGLRAQAQDVLGSINAWMNRCHGAGE